MKFETLLLRSLFAACLLVSGLILGSMLFKPLPSVQLARAGHADSATAMITPPGSCALPPDGVVCPRRVG
jgi:hypothetical protein